MVDVIFPLFLEVDIAVVLEDELVKLLDVGVLSLHAVVIGEGECGLIVPVDDVHRSQGGGLDRERQQGPDPELGQRGRGRNPGETQLCHKPS